MAGTLMLRSLDRTQRIYQAMIARGFDGEVRVAATAQPLTWPQRILIVVFALVGATIQYLV